MLNGSRFYGSLGTWNRIDGAVVFEVDVVGIRLSFSAWITAILLGILRENKIYYAEEKSLVQKLNVLSHMYLEFPVYHSNAGTRISEDHIWNRI